MRLDEVAAPAPDVRLTDDESAEIASRAMPVLRGALADPESGQGRASGPGRMAGVWRGTADLRGVSGRRDAVDEAAAQVRASPTLLRVLELTLAIGRLPTRSAGSRPP